MARLCLEKLEDRTVLSVTAAVRTIREATAAGPEANAQAGIAATVAAFQADLGGVNNGNAVGSQGTGRRQITWDGADNDSAPARLPANFFNAIAPRGAIFNSDPRIQFQQSADAANATGTADEFGNVNATYPTAFSVFSSPRLFTALNDNVMEVEFVIPGSLERATVSGFGAVFTDVDVFGSTRIEFFDVSGQKIFERTVLATAGNESLSFLGVTFVGAPLAKVRITSGAAAVGPNDITQTPGNPDIVVMDDFIYGEPLPLNNPRIAVGSDPGGMVRVLDATNGTQLALFQPYVGFLGAVTVAMGDVTGDGRDDIITGTGAGNPPHVKLFDGVTFAEIRSFFAFAPGFVSGVFVGAGNVNGDANIDILVSAGPGAPGGHVKVINGAANVPNQPDGQIAPAAELASFFTFEGFLGGVFVAGGDINGDFLDDVIVGAALLIPHVIVIDATELDNVQTNGVISNAGLLRSFFAYPSFDSGATVAGGDINGDGVADIITGATLGRGHIKAFSGGATSTELLSFFAFDAAFASGVRVGTVNIDDEGLIANILAAQGRGDSGTVLFEGVPLTQLDRVFAFGGGFTGGVFVAGSRF